MTSSEKVFHALKEMSIEYELVNHPAAITTEEADKYIEGKEGVRTKTLFLCNKKKTNFYLVIMDDAKQLDMKKFGEITGEKNIRFASAEKLEEKMDLQPGSVSLFGLLNNAEHDVKIYFDKEMLSEKIVTFLANDNTKTLFISTKDMYKFLQSLNYEYTVVDL